MFGLIICESLLVVLLDMWEAFKRGKKGRKGEKKGEKREKGEGDEKRGNWKQKKNNFVKKILRRFSNWAFKISGILYTPV